MVDVGLTHIALPVTDLDASLAFYAKYAGMHEVHRRRSLEADREVAWVSDLTRDFVIVLLEVERVDAPLLPFGHLGVACATRGELDQLCEEARREGVLLEGPTDSGPPVGYWAFLRDPDGHTLELSCGQEVGQTVERSRRGPAND
jgi:catechol 2,3-dioxygenase-like lactoylglutathione lyase family enzyme